MSRSHTRNLIGHSERGRWCLEDTSKIDTKGLFIANALVTSRSDSQVVVKVMNINDKAVTIPKNMKVAIFEPVQKSFSLTKLDMDTQQIITQSQTVQTVTPCKKTTSIYTTGKAFEESRDKIAKQLLLGDHDLTENQKERLLDALARNLQAFSFDGELGECDLMPHKINKQNDVIPIYKKSYRYSPKGTDQAKQNIGNLLKQDIIEPCISPWNAPLVIVQKPRKSPDQPIETRLCVDFRGLNDVTIPDRVYLPRLDATIDRLGSAKPQYFSTLDLIQGFFQQTLYPSSRDVTAFSFEGGQYRFKRLPMGLKNSPASYTRLIELVLKGLQYEICLSYIDDIIIYSRTFDEHLVHIEQVLQRLIKANLKVKISKCCFAKKEIKFLGNVLSAKGWSPDPEKTRVIHECRAPGNQKEVRRWLGMDGFYRKFIPHFAVIANPLYKRLKKDEKFLWSTECQNSFEKLKAALLQEPILGYPDFDKPFAVYTDAPLEGLSAMLTQLQSLEGQENERVIWYSGRSLNKYEKKLLNN